MTAASEELRTLRRAVRDVVAPRGVRPDVRTLAGPYAVAHEARVWQAMLDMGLGGVLVPEEFGGAGGDVTQCAAVVAELGACLSGRPYLASAGLAAWALTRSGDTSAQLEYLPALCAGELTMTAAPRTAHRPVTAQVTDGAWSLSGVAANVLDGLAAEVILVVADVDDRPTLFAAGAGSPGLRVTALTVLDVTRPLADVEFGRVPARLVGEVGATADLMSFGATMLAVEEASAARTVLDMTVEYARTRNQFGRAIGSFQAIKHLCARMLVDVEVADAAARTAVAALATDDAEWTRAASLAKCVASDAFERCTADAIQIHGGIGFTWEHPAQLYFKRAKSSARLFGDRQLHRDVLAAGIAPANA